MKRREFIGFAGVAVASWPLMVWAEQAAKIPRIGLLSHGRSEGSDASRATLDALVTGLRELGYTEGQNIAIEREFGGPNADRLRELASELVKRRVDIIVKQHSGSIEVDTQPGEFTEVRIILPRTAAFITDSRGRP